MSYRGSRVMSVDSFDGYDPTPYSGGFDLSLTYGRPLQPSVEICYPVFASGDVDLERAHYSSGSQTSVFKTGSAQKSDCCGLLRPGFQLQPQPVSNARYPGYGHQSYGHGGDGGGTSNYVRPSHGVAEEESSKFRSSGYGEKGSGGYKNSSYGDVYPSTGYRKPSYYGGEEGEGYGPSKYGNDSDDVEKKHSHHKHHLRHY